MDILGFIIFSLWFTSIIYALWYVATYAKGSHVKTRRYKENPNHFKLALGRFQRWLRNPSLSLPDWSFNFPDPSPKQKSYSSPKSSFSSVNPNTRHKLLTMLQGDELAAARLVNHIKGSNPGRSDQWCWEKAIWDLQRDRRI
jgi:hypothetical protein